jgi:hypothetical protein
MESKKQIELVEKKFLAQLEKEKVELRNKITQLNTSFETMKESSNYNQARDYN